MKFLMPRDQLNCFFGKRCQRLLHYLDCSQEWQRQTSVRFPQNFSLGGTHNLGKLWLNTQESNGEAAVL